MNFVFYYERPTSRIPLRDTKIYKKCNIWKYKKFCDFDCLTAVRDFFE